MIEKNNKDTNYFIFYNLSKEKGLVHFLSTVSAGDMAFPRNTSGKVVGNIRKFLLSFGIKLNNSVFARQVHSDTVSIISDGFSYEHENSEINIAGDTDAFVTAKKDIALVIKTADCTPIIIYDPKTRTVGLVHAGWRGTLQNIGRKTLKTMEKEFGVVPGNVLVGIGPSLGPEDFFIRSDVKKKFDEAGYKDMIRYISKDQWLINIWEINKQELIKEGVSPENIELSGISTYTSDKFFSYRRKNPEGHFITGVMLK